MAQARNSGYLPDERRWILQLASWKKIEICIFLPVDIKKNINGWWVVYYQQI